MAFPMTSQYSDLRFTGLAGKFSILYASKATLLTILYVIQAPSQHALYWYAIQHEASLSE